MRTALAVLMIFLGGCDAAEEVAVRDPRDVARCLDDWGVPSELLPSCARYLNDRRRDRGNVWRLDDGIIVRAAPVTLTHCRQGTDARWYCY
jgi:hypothetical protein